MSQDVQNLATKHSTSKLHGWLEKIKIKVFGHDHGPTYKFQPEKIRIKGSLRTQLLDADDKWGLSFDAINLLFLLMKIQEFPLKSSN